MTTAGKGLERSYLDEQFEVSNWEKLEPLFEELVQRPINSLQALEQWIFDRNELEAVVEENSRWRYIKVSVDNNDEQASQNFRYFVEHITPKLSPYKHQLNQKLIDSPFVNQLDQDRYFVYLRAVKNALQLFQESNIPLFTEEKIRTKEYGGYSAEMTIQIKGEELTMQQANVLQLDPNRELREEAWRKTAERRLQDAEKLDALFNDLLDIRKQVAENAGFDNFRDYKFAALGRFDYTPEDCSDFHDAVAKYIVPLVDQFNQKRLADLQLDKLRPWDMQVETSGDDPVKPYQGVEELIEKSIKSMAAVHPFFGECISTMRDMNHLDLDSRKGKRPGGYNMSLPETGVPFIFMNSADSLRDMRTMMHEGGHAVHAFLTRKMPLNIDKRPPSEIAELAAMAMEMLTMDQWGEFYPNEEQLQKAKLWQLQRSLALIPWIATIDKFQHWLYTNPGHSVEERDAAWTRIFHEFESPLVDWSGLEQYRDKYWQRQLHIYEVPFYYIEYGIAQLGAMAVRRKYCKQPQEAVDQYINALKLGYTRPIREVYKTAGIAFDFSAAYIQELAAFMQEEIDKF
ncbi:MAG: M3 family oligoendopeptidase [Bacteroidota bacterium]